jgi:hypothetical protein
MEQRTVRLDWSLAASLGLSLAILAAGAYWVLAHPAKRPQPSRHMSAAYGVQPEDLSRVTATSDLIVEGVVKEVYPAEWTTRSGNRPARVKEMLSDPNVQMRTPVLLDVLEVYKGKGVPGTLLFTLPGGTDGDVTVTSPFGMTLEPGQRIVAFLSTARKGAGPWSRISSFYPQLFLIADGEVLHGPEKTISRSRLETQLGFGGEQQ